MSLKLFHLLFILLSVFVTLGFATWAVETRMAGSNWLYLSSTVVSSVLGIGLIGYGAWVMRKFRTFPQTTTGKK